MMISKFMLNGNIIDFIQSNSVNRLRLVINFPFHLPSCDSSLPHLSLRMLLKVYSTSTMSELFMGG